MCACMDKNNDNMEGVATSAPDRTSYKPQHTDTGTQAVVVVVQLPPLTPEDDPQKR